MNGYTILISSIVVALVGLAVSVYYGKQAITDTADDAAVVFVVVPDLTSELQSGKKLFDAKCSKCHGANAAGRNGKGPPLIHMIYEPDHHADGAFELAAKIGVRGHHWLFGNMPPVENISDEEIASIIKYVRHVQRANGIGVSE